MAAVEERNIQNGQLDIPLKLHTIFPNSALLDLFYFFGFQDKPEWNPSNEELGVNFEINKVSGSVRS